MLLDIMTELYLWINLIVFQTEEEAKLKEQVMTLSKDLNSEKNRCAELQKTSDSTKESLATLQSDYYGKESELSAVRQDLKVCFIKYEHILINYYVQYLIIIVLFVM